MKNETTQNISLYGFVSYDRSAKVRWLLKELGVHHEDIWLSSEKKENETPEYLKLNPLGRIPTLKMGEHSMFESGGICAYLADHLSEKGFAPNHTSVERMAYQQWMYFAAATLDPLVTRIMIVEDIPPGDIFTQKETFLLTEASEALHYLDQVLSKNNYLVANQFSAADICVGYQLYFLRLWPAIKTILDECQNIGSYLARLMERPGAMAANVFSYEE